MSDFSNCTQVTPACPASEATPFGYVPDLAANAVLLAIFAVCLLAQVGLAVWYRTITFGIVLTIGIVLELVGYAARLQMHANVWGSGFITQAVTLVIGPSFLVAGIYLTIKHVVVYLGAQYSRLRPALWVWIFVGCDVLSVVLQATGAAMSATGDDQNTVDTGNNITVAGLVFGVVVQAFCLLLVADFGFHIWKDRTAFWTSERSSETSPGKFKFYLSCTSLAFVCIFIRCVYRVPELVGGWGNALMRDETEFLLLDGMMIAIASILMTAAHPGIYFPAISTRSLKRSKRGLAEKAITSSESSAQLPTAL